MHKNMYMKKIKITKSPAKPKAKKGKKYGKKK